MKIHISVFIAAGAVVLTGCGPNTETGLDDKSSGQPRAIAQGHDKVVHREPLNGDIIPKRNAPSVKGATAPVAASNLNQNPKSLRAATSSVDVSNYSGGRSKLSNKNLKPSRVVTVSDSTPSVHSSDTPSFDSSDTPSVHSIVPSVHSIVPSVHSSHHRSASPPRPRRVYDRVLFVAPQNALNMVTLEEAALMINHAIMARADDADWERLSQAVAGAIAHASIPSYPVVSLQDSLNFWEQCNGDMLIALAVGADCGGQEFNECHALMMLVGNMPMPTDKIEMEEFLRDNLIKDFVDEHAEQLAERLRLSERGIPDEYFGPLELNTAKILYGFAKNWSVRFPQVVSRDSDLARIVLKHGIHRAIDGQGNPRLRLDVERVNALVSSSREFARYTPADILTGIQRVLYVGEDAGGQGLLNEWFAVMNGAVEGPIFKRNRHSGFDQLSPDEGIVDEQNPVFRTIGYYFALCILHGRPTTLNLPTSFFKRLLDQELSVRDLEELDPPKYNLLRHYEGVTEQELEGLIFGVEDEPLPESDANVPLTFANKDAQLAKAIDNIVTHRYNIEFDMIAAGFFAVLPREIFYGYSPEQVKKYICATADIDKDAFIANIDFRYGNTHWTAEAEEGIRNMINGFTQEQIRNLLRFVTGFQALPSGGFASMGRFEFKAYDVATQELPYARTCFKSLYVPQYPTPERTAEILTNVVNQVRFMGMQEQR